MASNSNQRFLAQMLDAAQSGLISQSNGHLQSGLISEPNGQFQPESKLNESHMGYEAQLRELSQLRAIEEARQVANAVSLSNSHFQKNYNSYDSENMEADQQSVYQQNLDQHSVYQPSAVDQQSIYEQSVVQNDDYQTIKHYDELNNGSNNINYESLQQDIVENQKLSTHSLKNSNSKLTVEQPNSYLPQISSSQINKVNIEDYNTPQFKAMLDQILKPIILPPEHINYPAEWPSHENISKYLIIAYRKTTYTVLAFKSTFYKWNLHMYFKK